MVNVNTNKFDYIKQLENEIKLLKQRILNEIESSNKLLMSERLKNEQLEKENEMLRRRNYYLTFIK